MRWGGGDQVTDQAPVTCRPNAAHSVVPGGLRAHIRETVSPSPRGGGRSSGRNWSWRSASPPYPTPGGYQQRLGRDCVRVAWARGSWGGNKEENRRDDA